ncbi:MAG: choice-of-anchor D domain-containing protein [Ignavibacteria bacterium]|nr:choice-of-anchor D domain-containing protein [Ignavibacteria bacterium]
MRDSPSLPATPPSPPQRRESSRQDSIIVTNAGTATLSISSATVNNPRFTISGGGPGGIAPGGSRKYTVTFSPTAIGYQIGTVFFNHNATPNKDSVRVTGTGTGAALAPVFAAAAPSIDFGDVTNGQTKKDSVNVTNTGTAALSITSVVSSLGLYTVAPTTATLQPNASRMFVVTFAPLTSGPKPALLIFSHNAATKKDTLTLNGNGTGTDIAPHFTNAPAMLDFGTVNTGASLLDSIIVTNTGTASLSITNTSSTNARFTVTPRNATIAASTKRTFMITFAPTTPGEQRGFIRFPHNGTPVMDSVEVVGIGSGAAIEPVFAATPASLTFGLVDTGSFKTDSIKVTNTGTQSLTLANISSDNPRFTVSPRNATILPGAFRMFGVTFTPTTPGTQEANIIFPGNAASSPDTVRATGTGSAATQTPNFTATPSNLRYGYVETPKTKVDSVVVTNTGRAQLVISDVSSDNDQFTVTPKTATIETSSSVTFRIVFAPVGPNRAQGMIVFSHNAPNATDTVTVLGNDVLPSMISAARSQPAGTEVIVEGVVTRAKGSNLRMQDGSGGLTVRQTSGAFHDAIASGFVKMGDMLRVWGRLSEVTGLKQIAQADIISFDRLSRDHILPDPVQLTLPEVASTGEQYESMLIRVVDLTITPGTDTAFIAAKTYQIKDAVDSTRAVVLRIPAATDTENAGRKIPSTKAVFTGVLGQVATTDPAKGYQLLPVLLGDLTAPDPTGVEAASALPVSTTLLGSFPNPFSPATTISYALAAQSRVTLRVYSALGREIATLVDGVTETGTHSATWNGTDAAGLRVPAGIYLCRFTAEPLSAGTRIVSHTRTLVLMK